MVLTVRTITATLGDLGAEEAPGPKVAQRAALLARLRAALLADPGAGVAQVQTVRVSCSAADEWAEFAARGRAHGLARVQAFAAACEASGLEIFNAGPLRDPAAWAAVPELLRACPRLSVSAALDPLELRHDHALALARVVLDVSRVDPDGGANFRFCVSSRVPAGTPFYPASYSAVGSAPSFSLGLETSDLLEAACEAALVATGADAGRLLQRVEDELVARYRAALGPLHRACERLAAAEGASYAGIDASMNPSLAGRGIGWAFEAVLSRLAQAPSLFGHTGSLAVTLTVTRAIKRAAKDEGVLLAGYSGLMLPQLEDRGLAAAADAGACAVKDLLLCSAVCGVGVDTVPVPGDVAPEKLALLILDMQALSLRWDKPLSCRVLPVPGKQAGQRTQFNNPHLTDSVVLALP